MPSAGHGLLHVPSPPLFSPSPLRPSHPVSHPPGKALSRHLLRGYSPSQTNQAACREGSSKGEGRALVLRRKRARRGAQPRVGEAKCSEGGAEGGRRTGRGGRPRPADADHPCGATRVHRGDCAHRPELNSAHQYGKEDVQPSDRAHDEAHGGGEGSQGDGGQRHRREDGSAGRAEAS